METGSKVRISEIFHSIQGESSHAGKPCVFVRLTGCSLRCGYCDTTYAYGGGVQMSVENVVARVLRYPTRLVEITGGEPLEQEEVYVLMDALLRAGWTVMLETGGHVGIERVPKPVIKIIDIKCPDSAATDTFFWQNLELAQPHDEFKFVISSRRDYEWSRDLVHRQLAGRPNTILFSPSHGEMPPQDLAAWILQDNLSVRLQLQIHKYIWGAQIRGV